MKSARYLCPAALFVAVGMFFFWVLGEKPSKIGDDPLARRSEEICYCTSPKLEPDTCVAAWLLTRFVTPGAPVLISDDCADCIPFDIPGCDLQRRPGLSCSGVVLERYEIRDPLAIKVVSIINQLELSPWSTSEDPFFEELRMGLSEAIHVSESIEAALDKAIAFLDAQQAPDNHHSNTE